MFHRPQRGARGISSPYDPRNPSIVAILEDVFLSRTYPPADSDLHATRELAKAIETTREQRVPPEVLEAERIVEAAAREIRTASRLGMAPVNPQHRPDVARAAAGE